MMKEEVSMAEKGQGDFKRTEEIQSKEANDRRSLGFSETHEQVSDVYMEGTIDEVSEEE
jgi:hypothetical protein